MTDFDNTIREALQAEQASREAGRVPAFDDTFAVAEARAAAQMRRRWTVLGIAAAAAVVAVATSLLLPRGEDWQYVNPDDLATSTAWVAPSDVLLPERSFDIYRDIPVLIESTDSNGGALL